MQQLLRKGKFNSNTKIQELLMYDEDLEIIPQCFYDLHKSNIKVVYQTADNQNFSKNKLGWVESQYQALEKINESENDDSQYVQSSDQQSEEKTFYTINNAPTNTFGCKSTLRQIMNKYNFNLTTSGSSNNNLRSSEIKSEIKRSNQYDICCAKNFFENQILKFKPGYRVDLMDRNFPFSHSTISEIKKKCCSFLNADGGILYFGIEKIGPSYYIKHQILSQQDKEDVLKAFRQIFDNIIPDITVKRKYKVQFVPVRKNKSSNFIKGGYIVRVKINYGVRDELYCYSENDIDYFPFRSDEGIQLKQGMKILKIYKQILKNPLPIPEPIHEGPCENPDLGQLLFQTKNTKKQNKQKSTKLNDRSDDNLNSNVLARAKQHDENSSIDQSFEQNSNSNERAYLLQQKATLNSKQLIPLESYFFAEGLNEKDLEPLLKKYNLVENVFIEEYSQKKIIIKVKAKSAKFARNLLDQLEKKYKGKIIITQMSLKLKVNHNALRQVLECLEGMGPKYKFQGSNILIFEKMLQSFQAFMLAQNYRRSIQFLMK